jgi:hypothetical protein
MIYGIEFGMVLVALALAFTLPDLGSRWFEAVERALGKLAEKPRLAVVVTGLTALATRAALLPILPVPEPAFHDEFCYLLAADTFAHGRLANPTHPMWIHFETSYVLWHPVYASMFPPAQGLIMAFGQAVLGHPFWGVWLSLGLMCAALTWMLQGWLSPKWALLGGLLAVIRLATFSYWANSYWGGAVAATGGALVFGALPRLKQSLRVLDALLLGLGLAILANSRPYEGLVISLPVLAALLAWMFGKDSPPFRATLRRLVLPAGLLLGIVAVLMGYYSWRVTGSPWHMPHQYYAQTYHTPPYFLGQAPRPLPTFHHAAMRDFFVKWELPAWEQTRTLGGMLRMEGTKAIEIWTFYLLPLFTLPLLMAMAALPYGFSWRQISPGTRFLLMATGFGLAGYALEVQFHPHYIAPGPCLVFALVMAAMRNVRSWRWRQKSVGLAITRAIPLIAGALLVLCAAWGPSLRPWQPVLWTWCSPGASDLMSDRARILAHLQQEPGQHLVIVRYSAGHQFGLDWVYNRADIDASKVIWARDMGREQNAELLRYFQDRRIWLVEPDLTPPRLSAYPAE